MVSLLDECYLYVWGISSLVKVKGIDVFIIIFEKLEKNSVKDLLYSSTIVNIITTQRIPKYVEISDYRTQRYIQVK